MSVPSVSGRLHKVKVSERPTRHLLLFNVLTDSAIASENGDSQLRAEMEQLCAQFGVLQLQTLSDDSTGDTVHVVRDKNCLLVSFIDENSAMSMMKSGDKTSLRLMQRQLVPKYATVSSVGSVPVPECTSATQSVAVPGLSVIADFVTVEEAQQLVKQYLRANTDAEPGKQRASEDNVTDDNACNESRWENLSSRKVKHFGFRFNFQTYLMEHRATVPPVPTELLQLLHGRLQQHNAQQQHASNIVPIAPVDQLTINHYLPGQGIASHFDNSECIGPVIYVLSLLSGVVMTFKRSDDSYGACTGGTSDGPDATDNRDSVRSHVWLPARSLLVLAGDSRFNWTHGISTRKLDQVSGRLVPREERASFTFREATRIVDVD